MKCLERTAISKGENHLKNLITFKCKTTDARSIDNLERLDSSQEIINPIERWRNTVKQGMETRNRSQQQHEDYQRDWQLSFFVISKGVHTDRTNKIIRAIENATGI